MGAVDRSGRVGSGPGDASAAFWGAAVGTHTGRARLPGVFCYFRSGSGTGPGTSPMATGPGTGLGTDTPWSGMVGARDRDREGHAGRVPIARAPGSDAGRQGSLMLSGGLSGGPLGPSGGSLGALWELFGELWALWDSLGALCAL